MGRWRQGEGDGLYEHVLTRLAVAMRRAEAAGQEVSELEIEGLSGAELALIQAYLQRDAQWLSGWHAAAHEQALLARRALARQWMPPRRGERGRLPRLPNRTTLDCALCGMEVLLPRRPGVATCPCCGSDLMRVRHCAGDRYH